MDTQREFNEIIEDLCEERCLDGKVEKGSEFLLSLCISGEIRDVEWIVGENGVNLYQALFRRLYRLWQFIPPGKSVANPEAALLRIWSSIVLSSEYDSDSAYGSSSINANFLEQAIKRIMTLSKFADSGSTTSVHGLTPSAAIFVLQQLVIRAYTHRTDIRERVRHLIVKYLLCVNQSTKDTERSSLDGGKTRAHVQHLLKILQAIITGFQVTSDADVYQQRRELLLDVLIPLHLPNEMIEWRDQIPVLQMYHEDLVKCVVALAQKSDEGYYTTTGRPTDSLLTEALMQVLRHWPESFNTNTPKQVLLLHEIEILVERLDVARLFPVHDALLDRLVKCVGTNADNIRPAQRALQFFKNTKVMDVLFPVASEVSDASETLRQRHPDAKSSTRSRIDRIDESNDEDVEDDETERYRVAKKTFETLLPSLYRSGQPSWNPTVNKMTALGLKRFMEINEALVRNSLEDYFGRHLNGNRLARALRPSSSTTSLDFKSNEDDSDTRFLSPAGPLSAVSQGLPSGRLPPKAGLKKAFDATARMPGSGPVSISGPSFPPTVRPRTTLDGTATASHGSSLSSNPSGRMNPPVTITGVAPWAMHKATPAAATATSSVNTMHQPHASVPLHTVPPSAIAQAKHGPPVTFPSELNTQRVMLPVPPPSSMHPGGHRAIASTVSESKQRDAALLAAARSEGDDSDGDKDDAAASAAHGFALLHGYMLKLYPQIFANDGDSASLEAQGKDWCLTQAAATPSLLPNLKFHDLVFGQILGEGAFSTVKYARHITKGKAQSEWPEYAVKVIDAKKVLEFQYSLSVIREISVLQLLVHPGISRMIQAFQYHGSAYLILEYASRGDLHTYLLKAGRLLSTRHALLRFIIGEIASAVHVIHEHGFVYNDLKPENILITELGHVKITDFGACRPYTTQSKHLVRESCQRLMDLPDGNWKVTSKDEEDETTGAWRSIFQDPRLWEAGQPGPESKENTDSDSKDSNHHEDKRRTLVERAEGTPGYMPPEAFSSSGAIQSDGCDILLDAWSLGCVLYFAFHGKPRFYGEEASTIMEQMQIWFEERAETEMQAGASAAAAAAAASGHQVHFTAGHDAGHHSGSESSLLSRYQQAACEAMISQLLSLRGERLSVAGVLDHPYITTGLLPEHHQSLHDGGHHQTETELPTAYDPRSLHAMAPPRWPEVSEDGGSQGGDSRWARRQFSTLWAPMPHAYNVQGDESVAPAFLSQHMKGGSGHSRDESDLLHSVLRVPLPSVEETAAELRSSFISRF